MAEHREPVGDQGMGGYHHPQGLGHDAWIGERLP